MVHLAFAKELRVPISLTDVGAQKINGNTLNIYRMIVVAFSVKNKADQVRFFEKNFLVTNISLEIVLGIPFFTLSGVDIDFLGRELRWRTYIIEEAFPTTRRVEIVGKKEFAAAALNLEYETYVVHVGLVSSDVLPSSSSLEFDVHPFHRPQVFSLIAKKTPTKVPDEYSDFPDVFSLDLASKLPKHIRINNHIIELVDSQQPPYEPIYSLRPVELETLKAYIKTNLANGFIKPSKSPAGASILFNRKSDGFFRLCVNYRGLNNLTIKN